MSSSQNPLGSSGFQVNITGKKKIGIITAEWNQDITSALRNGCIDTLVSHGIDSENIKSIAVPGTFELIYGAKLLLKSAVFDAIICIGCVITGETKHDEYISSSVAQALATLNAVADIPVIFGVLTPLNIQQAKDRAGGQYGNKGVEAAQTALKMIVLKDELNAKKQSIGFGV